MEHHGPTGTAIFFTPVGVKWGTRIVIMVEQDGATSLVRPAKAVEEEDVALSCADSSFECGSETRHDTSRLVVVH